MTYWLDLFTGGTWKEFQTAGAKVTGFREQNWKRSEPIRTGDIFLCYLVGVSRWVGLLEVTEERFRDESPIWSEEPFPVRFKVKPLVMLSPEHGVPMTALEGQLSFFKNGDTASRWSGFVRSSPTKYKSEDGEAVSKALKEASTSPVSRPVNPRKLARSPNLYQRSLKQDGESIDTFITVPSKEDEAPALPSEELQAVNLTEPSHTEIQWRLLDLGSKMGLKVWAPKSDRGRGWNGKAISEVPRLLASLPTNFDDLTNEIVGNIDVLWLSEENAIVAAFEVEHSTMIYSGLLRMSDLLTMQPNIDIKLYIVGPDDRYTKFVKEIPRPTFAYRKKPLYRLCRFLPHSTFCHRLDAVKDVIQYLRPEFLDDIALLHDPATQQE